ncbi:MAG: hypothetical protein QXU18_08095 [Thermoplasmatales archaeon]
MEKEKYREIAFSREEIGSVFAKYRKPFRKERLTKKRMIELVEKGTDMILNNSLNDDPYTEEMLNKYFGLCANK